MAETTNTPAPAQAPKSASPATGLAVGALVSGIVAFIFGWTPIFGLLAGIAGVVLGILALKKGGVGSAKGMSIAGIITGGIGALWSLIITVFFVLALAFTGAAVGTIANEANKALDQYNAENRALMEAKKDFAQGETAKFGDFEVKVNSIKRNYQPSDYFTAGEGKEYIVLNVTVKNTSDEDKVLSSYELKVLEGDLATGPTFLSVEPSLDSGTLTAGGSSTGNIPYEVTKGATDLKLRYETYAYDLSNGMQTVVFTLAL